jgi:hypothetical protein
VNPKESNVKKTVALISSIAALTLAACGSSTPAPTPTKVSLGTATAGTYTVELSRPPARRSPMPWRPSGR